MAPKGKAKAAQSLGPAKPKVKGKAKPVDKGCVRSAATASQSSAGSIGAAPSSGKTSSPSKAEVAELPKCLAPSSDCPDKVVNHAAGRLYRTKLKAYDRSMLNQLQGQRTGLSVH